MALIQCKHCGQPISDKATICPKCGKHNTKTLKEVFNSEWGKGFYVACALLLLNAMFGILCNLFSLSSSLYDDRIFSVVFFNWWNYFGRWYFLGLIYYLGFIGITWIIGQSFTKKNQIITMCLCGIAFILRVAVPVAFRRDFFDGEWDFLSLDLIRYAILAALFIILAKQVKGRIKNSMLLMLVPLLCDIILLFIDVSNALGYYEVLDGLPPYRYAIDIFGNIITICAVISLIYHVRQCSKQVSKVESLPNSISQEERTWRNVW